MRVPNWRRLAAATGAVLVAAMVGVVLAAEVASEPAKAGPEKSASSGNPLVVPEGGPEELVKFLEKLSQSRPEQPDEKTAKEFNEKVAPLALKAADKILAGKPTEEQAKIAAEAKADVYQSQAAAGDRQAAKKLQALPGELEKAGWPKLAREVRGLALRTALMEATRPGGPDLKKTLDEVKQYVSAGPLGRSEVELAMTAAGMAEHAGDRAVAIDANRYFGQLFSKSDIQPIARLGARLEGAARRLELPGKKMPIEGTTLEGKPFQWGDYRGKVVLVTFWATWCGPCRQEIKTIREEYKAYHNRGFDVVAISIDEDRKELEKFAKESNLPWTVLVDMAGQGKDEDQSMAARYGISSIPETILVGKDGKVIATGIDGASLGEQLKELLGPAVARKGADDERK